MSNILKTISLAVALSLVLLVANRTVSAQPERAIPMWEGIEKTAAQKKIDRDFVKKMVRTAYGNADEAARNAMLLGWKELHEGDPETAIRRFNQAWLIKPERGDIYWGFAIAISNRGESLEEVERWFKKAESIIGPQWALHSDWGRVLEERGQPKAAIPHFLKSIEANPEYRESRAGIARAYLALGDRKNAEKHAKIFQSLPE